MVDNLRGKRIEDESSTVPCQCKHPSHGAEGCKKPTLADEEICAACEHHVPYTDTL
jgi:hypothetical protein